MTRNWDERYATGDLPWDRNGPDPELVKLIESGHLPHGRALDVGCGTGTNARYLAGRGWDVLGVDGSRLAIERAKAKTESSGSVELRHHDFLHDELDAGRFDLVFDRGCFHVFDDPKDRARFARRVAGCLAPDGLWVSFIGSTEGLPRDDGPPRRSARDIALAVEPALEIAELRGFELNADLRSGKRGWVLLARHREVPAQPSTVRDE